MERRRAVPPRKKGGIAPWGPSFQHADGCLRLHTFATVIGLMLVSLAKITLGTTRLGAPHDGLARRGPCNAGSDDNRVTGRRPTIAIPPELTTEQRRAVKVFELERWLPSLLA